MQIISSISHKDFNNKIGIYQIFCNEDSYIGSSKNIYYRLRRHLADLRRKSHANKFLQNIFNKYGEDKVYVKILEFTTITDRAYLLNREKIYIKWFNPTINHIKDPVHIELSQESRNKISQSLKEGHLSGKINITNNKSVHRYDLNGIYIDSFMSMSHAARSVGKIRGDKIRRAIIRGGSCSGFLWSFTKERNLKAYIYFKSRPVILQGGFGIKTFPSCRSVAEFLKISESVVYHSCVSNKVLNGVKYSFLSQDKIP